MKKSRIITLLGTLTLALGGLVAFSQVSKKGNFEEAKAADAIPTEFQSTLRLELNSGIWGSANAYYTVHFWGGDAIDSEFPGVELGTASGNTVLSCTYDRRATHLQIVRFNPDDHSKEWNRWNYFDENSFIAGQYNYFKNDGWTSCHSYKAILPGDSIYLDCNNSLDGGWRWDNDNAHFKAYLWGSKEITLQGRNLVHGVNDNDHIYEFTVEEETEGYWLNVKFDRCDSNYSVWNQSVNFTNIENNAFAINGQSGDKYTAAQWYLRDEYRQEYFARYLLNTCTCDGQKYTFDDSKWADIKTEYNNMSHYTRGVFNNVTSDTGSEETLANAAGRYDILVSRRGFENFASRSVSASLPLNRISDIVSNSSSTIFVVIAGVLGISTIGGYLFIRKRKHI